MSQRMFSDISGVTGRNGFMLLVWSGCWHVFAGTQCTPNLSRCSGHTPSLPKMPNPWIRIQMIMMWPSDRISAVKSSLCPHFSPNLLRCDVMSLWQSNNFTKCVSCGCYLLKLQSVSANTETEHGGIHVVYSATYELFSSREITRTVFFQNLKLPLSYLEKNSQLFFWLRVFFW